MSGPPQRRAAPRRRAVAARAAEGGGAGEALACLAVLAVALAALSIWLTGEVAAVVSGSGWPRVPASRCLALLVGVVGHPRDPRVAWPHAVRGEIPGPALWYAALAFVWIVAAGVALGARALVRRTSRAVPGARPRAAGREPAGATWAARADVSRLAVPGPGMGRLVLGRVGRRLVAVERGQSLLVVGPTQSGKTTGLAIPALLEWEGPVLATSVKTDLVRESHRRRQALGEVRVFDPTGVCDLGGAGWSPLAAASTWPGARRTAAGLCGVARGAAGGLEDGAFWYATAEKLLAPLLFAAATSGGTIADVVRWVDTGEVGDVLIALELAGVPEAVRAAEASFSREERQRSSVYTTAETVLAAYADPLVALSCERHDLDPARLLGGGSDTVFLVAPAHEQERLQSVFVAIVRSVVEDAMTLSSRQGAPLDPPLLVVLDEAANVAPLSTLDTLASTAASHGIQLVTVWQDLAQLEARYGARAATVVNNHRAKLLCSGIADATTLEQVGRIIGDESHETVSSTVDASGGWSRTSSTVSRRLAPAELLRCMAPGDAVLVYGNLPPVRLALRPVTTDRDLRRLASGGPGPADGPAGRPATSGPRAARGLRPRLLHRRSRRAPANAIAAAGPGTR